jgi:hypothetical protein
MAERDKSYNGWRNYETWNVHLWLSNEEGDWNHWRAIAQHIADHAPESENVKRRIWTTDEAARFALADQLKNELRDGDSFPNLPPSMNSDLLRAAFDEVDWHEVAAALLEGIEPAQEEPADSGISDADPVL